MDERKLGELFRDAVPDVPPPTFDADDVATASGRLQLRRRNALLGGSVLTVVLLAGAAVLGVALWRGTDSSNSSPTAAVAGANSNADIAPNEVPSGDKSFSVEPPKQGGVTTENAGPSGAGSTPRGCGRADPELVAALAGELRAAAPDPVQLSVDCPPNAHGAAYSVTVNGVRGTVSLVVSPDLPVTASGDAAGAQRAIAYTQDGRQVVVVAAPTAGAGAAPFAGELQNIANRLSVKV
jgi:hypothetical protein